MRNQETAMTRARLAYEKRTQLKIVPIRLDLAARERLERLAAKHGGKRAAVELALELLDISDDPD